MARPRSSRWAWLPPYVYARGAWLYLYEYADGCVLRPRKLCRANLPRSAVWASYERETGAVALTLDRLCEKFRDSPQWANLEQSTRDDYLRCESMFCESRGAGERFGSWPVARFTPGVLTQYKDLRAIEAPSRARHEIRWAKRVFRWGFQRDLVPSNIAAGVEVGTEPVRKRYVADGELAAFQAAARASGSPWLAPFSEIAYACRLRPSEALMLTDASLKPEGIECKRTKGSDDNVVRLRGALAEAIEEAQRLRTARYEARKLAVPLRAGDRPLFVNQRGQRVTYSGLSTAWRALMADRVPEKRFSPHDLKRKGISDARGDKRKAAGHRSPQMTANYDTRRDVVMPSQRKQTKG